MLSTLFRSFASVALLLATPLLAQEICTNGVDDDGDGLVDLNDADACTCDSLPNSSTPFLSNPMFEEFDCDPALFEQFACAHDWYSATLSTPDFLAYGSFWIPWVPPPVNGVGVVGGYVMNEDPELVGTCLLTPLTTGVEYTFRTRIVGRSSIASTTPAVVLPPLNITVWGYAQCPTWPPGPISTCPGAFGWTSLATIPYVPEPQWDQVSVTFTTPFAVQAIVIGAPCDGPPAYSVANGITPYVIYDDLELFTTTAFSGTLARSGGWCTDDLVLHAGADTSAATFQWYRNGVALVGRTDSLLQLSADALGVGTYQVRISVGARCLVRTLVIAADVMPVVRFTAAPDSGCAPLRVQFTNTSTADTLIHVHWDFGDGDTSSTFAPEHTYTTPGVYDVGLRVDGSNGCRADSTRMDLVHVLAPPQAAFTFTPAPTDIYATELSFTNGSSADVVHWAWSFSGGSPATDTLPDPTVRFPGEEGGTYAVQLIVTNAQGCTDTLHAYVVINGQLSLYGPNAFSPNGDGINDDWRPLWRDLDPRDYHLRIFDRWGEEVWSSTDALQGWDGRYKGAAPKTDVFAWKLDGRDAVEGEAFTVFGHVTVLQ